MHGSGVRWTHACTGQEFAELLGRVHACLGQEFAGLMQAWVKSLLDSWVGLMHAQFRSSLDSCIGFTHTQVRSSLDSWVKLHTDFDVFLFVLLLDSLLTLQQLLMTRNLSFCFTFQNIKNICLYSCVCMCAHACMCVCVVHMHVDARGQPQVLFLR